MSGVRKTTISVRFEHMAKFRNDERGRFFKTCHDDFSGSMAWPPISAKNIIPCPDNAC